MFGIDPVDLQRLQLFHPFAFNKMASAVTSNARFVHYTSADTAMKIIQNEEVWMRKSTCINDFNEIEHGFHCLQLAYTEHKDRFVSVVDSLFPGLCKKIEDHFNGWLPSFRNSTYIACISEHDDSEDMNGRLSMWRAYGSPRGVALVLKSGPFLRPSDALQAYTSPVAYLSEKQFSDEFSSLIEGLEKGKSILSAMSEDELLGSLFEVFRMATLCTKHPGFAEEREWRIIYSPSMSESLRIKADLFTFDGVPQRIFKIPMQNVVEEGLYGIEVREVLDRIIIGPTNFAVEIKEALGVVLESKGVEQPLSMIWISDIPLRN